MASGYGLHGGPGRCFPFWQEMLQCYVINSSTDDIRGAAKCAPALEDYHECLHHKKELARARTMAAAYRRAQYASPRDAGPKSGEIKSLGLLKVDEDGGKR